MREKYGLDRNIKRKAVIAAVLVVCLVLGSIVGLAYTGEYDPTNANDYGAAKATSANSSKKLRTFILVTVNTNNATTYKINVKAGVTSNYSGAATVNGCVLSYSSGKEATNGEKSKSDSSWSYSNSDSTNQKNFVNWTYSWTKTSSKQSMKITMSGYGNGGNNWGSSSSKSTATYTVTVPALATHTVTCNPNGGSGGATKTVSHGSNVTLPGAATRTDYTFASWGGYAAGSSYGPVNSNVTLYAKWYPNVYFNINAKGPSGATSTDAVLKEPHGEGIFVTQSGMIQRNGVNIRSAGATYNLLNYNYSGYMNAEKPGYHVDAGAEWNTRPDGTGTSYNQDTDYAASTFTSPITLYLSWKPNRYTVRYLPNGADAGSMPTQTITFDSEAKAISNSYIRDGYKLRGWDRDPDADPAGSLDIIGDKAAISGALLEGCENGDTIELYAIWYPILKSETEIHAGKIVNEDSNDPASTDSYLFRLEPVEGMSTDNESTFESGRQLTADEIPLTEDTPEGQKYKDIEVTGIAGNARMLRTGSFGLIRFEEPGWYMYKVTELSETDPKIIYDKTSYFVTCYVQYEQDTGWAAEVSNTTAYHNRYGLANNRPNTEDISTVTDNNGVAASDNDNDPATAKEKNSFGKTAIGHQSVIVTFFNSEAAPGGGTVSPPGTSDILVTKNLKGNLGDRTKKFEFTAEITGLAPGCTYSVTNDDAELGNGFNGGDSITADNYGSARLSFKLSDDASILLSDIPLGTTFDFIESGSDHIPGYIVYTSNGTVKEGHSFFGSSSASTGKVTLTEGGELYTVLFENYRELAANTGVLERGLPLASIVVVLLLAGILLLKKKTG